MGETTSLLTNREGVGRNTTFESPPPRRIDQVVEHCNNQEKEMRNLLAEIIKSSKSNYRFKASTNSILIIIGVILITSPIVFTWLGGTVNLDTSLTHLNYFLGGTGVVTFS